MVFRYVGPLSYDCVPQVNDSRDPLNETWEVVDRHFEPRYVVLPDGSGGHWSVCEPYHSEYCHLIAAAPELYRALEAMVAYANAEHKGLRIADEALAKARGEV